MTTEPLDCKNYKDSTRGTRCLKVYSNLGWSAADFDSSCRHTTAISPGKWQPSTAVHCADISTLAACITSQYVLSAAMDASHSHATTIHPTQRNTPDATAHRLMYQHRQLKHRATCLAADLQQTCTKCRKSTCTIDAKCSEENSKPPSQKSVDNGESASASLNPSACGCQLQSCSPHALANRCKVHVSGRQLVGVRAFVSQTCLCPQSMQHLSTRASLPTCLKPVYLHRHK